MKITLSFVLSFVAVFIFVVGSYAQSRTIAKDEYDRVFRFAVTNTNAAYPVIYKVVTTSFENGKAVRTVTELNENEASGRYRIKRTILTDGRETHTYQLTVGFGNIFCSDDGVNWKISKYECPAERVLYIRPDAESVEYSVNEKSVNGQRLKIYREYTIFASSGGVNTPKTFKEKVSTVDARGFFVTVFDTEGKLDPKTVTLTREQSWVTPARIEPVTAPFK